jgi:uncharacterized protein involved in exopolysaccharide biosynthesis
MDQTSEAVPYRHDVDAFDVQASLRRLREAVSGHLVLIAASALVSLGLALVYVKVFPPIYRAEVVISGEANDDKSRDSYYALWNIFRKGDLKNEPELMTSRGVVREVVEKLDLKFDDVYHPVLTQIGYLWTQSWLGRTYRKAKEWIWAPDPSEYKPTEAEIDRARTIEAFREGVTLTPVGSSTIGLLSVKAPSYRAAEFANKLIDVYLVQRREVGSTEAETSYLSLKAELEKAAKELTEAEREKVAFDKANGLTVEFERDKVLLGKWGELRGAIYDLEATIAAGEAGLAVIRGQLRDEPREIINTRTIQASRVRGLMQTREFELNASVQTLQERYRPDSPEVVEAKRLLEETRAMLAKEPELTELGQSKVINPSWQALKQQEQALVAQLESNKATLAQRRAAYGQLSQRMDALPAIFANAHVVARKREAAEVRYKMLNERFMMADVSRATAMSAPSSLRVVDYAAPPMKKSWPDLKILLPAALLVGLLFGVGIAVLAEMFSARATRDRLATFRDMPIYAVVGRSPAPAEGAPPEPDKTSGTALGRLRRTA